ncbi:V-type ATP synthase subunit B [Geomesophilobacter sediminis]|uniref:V-type ATP synthase beta chain n=1 Tax=Geomesophilobacter sediminis TaxID=2798584 RepID=A0A8J7J7G6_9BACT|nr:V-type ATP synthase subunit B [Geomesophilobacter sediminis]MBJ6725171.1 V-type ATP synthase subunit B [Geomesophilobacter sediminis]
MRLAEHSYRTITSVRGPLLFVEGVFGARIGEVVGVEFPDGAGATGEVLKITGNAVLIQVFGETAGLDIDATVVFTDSVRQVPLSRKALGRVFNGSFAPIDGAPMYIPERWGTVSGLPLNPTARARPEEFIETGYTAIDLLNTLVKGQKLPIFSNAGLPSLELAAGILRNARLSGGGAFAVVFVALGLTHREYSFYMEVLSEMHTGFVAFVNRADEPVVERLLAPRFGLTCAEYLAFACGMDVLVLVTDMTNYCDALREVSTAREELPGRRGYPGYMYSDLASLYERAGRIGGESGSVTMIPVLTMPEDDITHPIPDLTGYITEGQIVLSRELHQQGVFPPIDVLPSLSRLMQRGIGAGRTRADHREVADRLYRHYAKGRDLRRLEAIVGREGMLAADRQLLSFAEAFERELVHQGTLRREIGGSLDAGIDLLQRFSLEDS